MFRSSLRPVRATAARDAIIAAAVLAASAAFVPAAASAAECVNGYETLPNQVILLCGEAAQHAGALALHQSGAVATPVPAPEAAAGHSIMAASPAECRPGMYRSFANPSSGDQIIPC